MELFQYSDEHDALRETVRQFIEKNSEETTVRELMASERGYDPATWKQMAQEIGLQGLIISEEYGGGGFGFLELGIVCEEMGRRLLCAPFLSTAVLAASTLNHCASAPNQKELLSRIASGDAIATLAHAEPGNRWDARSIQMQAKQDGEGWRLNGSKSHVLDGSLADIVLVAARTPEGLALFRVDPDAEGLTRTNLPALDPTRKLAALEFENTLAVRIDSGSDIEANLQTALDETVVALSAEQSGGTQLVLEMATDYAKSRFQFGRPIGSYQSIKHHCANMLVASELSKTAVQFAAWCADFARGDLVEAVCLAKSQCSRAYFNVCNTNIQVHGGMGFTWEHPAHLYLKRATGSEQLFGQPTSFRARLGDLLELES